jgi:hypothetical protein
MHDKPAAFVERLDQAEDYLNERLTANGRDLAAGRQGTDNARLAAPFGLT